MICFTIKKTFDDTGLDIKGSNSNTFENQSQHHEDFRHRNFWGCSRVVGDFFFERHTYNYEDYGEQAIMLPKLEMRTIILGWREYNEDPLEKDKPHNYGGHVFTRPSFTLIIVLGV